MRVPSAAPGARDPVLPPGEPPRSPDARLLWALVGLALLTRLITLPPIDAGGDALLKWYQAKILLGLVPGEWVWSHHTARFGIMLPILGVQAAFGTHPALYYVPALAMSLVQTGLAFQIGNRLQGPALGTAIALFLIAFEPMRMSATQLLPGIFSSSYVLVSLSALLAYRDRAEPDRRARLYLALSAVALFAAYTTKLSNAFFVPGFYVAAGLWRKSPRDVVLYAGIVTALVACEIGAYAAWTEYPLGRISMVLGAHSPMGPLDSVWGLFRRYAELPWEWGTLVVVHALGSALLIGRALRTGLDDRALGVLAIPLSFLCGLTFSVRSLDPLLPSQAFNARYLTAAAPLLALVAGLGVVRSVPGSAFPRRVAAAVAAALVTGVLGWQTYRGFPGLENHPLELLDRYRHSAAEFEAGTPVVSIDPRGLGVESWLMLFWDGPPLPVLLQREASGGFWYASSEPGLPLQTGRVLHADVRRRSESDSYEFQLTRGQVKILGGSQDPPSPATSRARGGS